MSAGMTEDPKNVAGQAVRGPDLWGRGSDVASLWRRVERESVLLAAPRRYGKTSLMYALLDRPLPGWQVIYLNVEFVQSAREFGNELLSALLRGAGVPVRARLGTLGSGLAGWFSRLVEGADVGVPDVAELKLRLRQAPLDDWRAPVEALWRAVTEANPNTLVILDELPVMLQAMLDADRAEAVTFLHWFRALRASGRFLVGGSVNVEPVLRALGESALLNDLGRFRVRPFPPEDAVRFVGAVFAGERVVVESGVAEAMVAVAQTGVPFFLQVYIDEALTEARERKLVLGPRLAEEVFRATVLGPRCASRFGHYLERLRHYGNDEGGARELLWEAASTAVVPVARAHQLARDAGADPARLVTRLESDWYLECSGDELRFADGFVQRWWQRNAPVGRVR